MNEQMQKALDELTSKVMKLTPPIVAISDEEYKADQQLIADYMMATGPKDVDINILKLGAMYRRLIMVKQQFAEIAECKNLHDLVICCKKQDMKDEMVVIPI